jgi:hypothetical protein
MKHAVWRRFSGKFLKPGTVFSMVRGISELKFVLLQDAITMNPAQWITETKPAFILFVVLGS